MALLEISKTNSNIAIPSQSRRSALLKGKFHSHQKFRKRYQEKQRPEIIFKDIQIFKYSQFKKSNFESTFDQFLIQFKA